ncbi:Na+/H+ antiporter subunit C [Lujinxingia vulgaris]|uniref:Na+/H+ antiporter subunit C n=1 Tax=Lujinxingia vulgaris TaxID=2600176 RepID=A0A5C6XHM9_9DELT|nr:NADH-quinone oxidoreductase subunit K [Lujinxingia vulgaris]TXD39374.1 Na+/H+ antiporter subunit C [Lujinxingia vulgaris]
MIPSEIYVVAGAGLVSVGLFAWVVRRHLVRRMMGVNVLSTGVFMMLIGGARRVDGVPDAVPQAMVLTGIVVAVSATALGLALIQHIYEHRSQQSVGERGPL